MTRLFGMALAVGVLAAPDSARAAVLTFTCTNPASGSTFDVVVDPEHGTANSFPAEITDRTITWHDTVSRGNYSLDRGTGALIARFASSTGGYFLRHTCRSAS